MKNQYYLKDKKATIYTRLPGYKDANAVYHKGSVMPITPAPVWCYARQQTQGLKFAAGIAFLNDESRLFIFCNNPHIKPNCFVLYRGTWYTIQRVDTYDDYNGDMFVYVDETGVGDKPKDAELIAYDASKL